MNNSKFLKCFIILGISLFTLFQGLCQNSASESNATAAVQLKVLSFNIRYAGAADHDGVNCWNNRKEAVAALVNDMSPDILGLQEAEIVQVHFFEEQFPQYVRLGVGRDDGKEQGEFTALFYLRDRYELVQSGYFWLNESTDKPALGWDAHCNRTVTWAHLVDVNTAKEFIVLNTHLDHAGKLARQNSILLILDKLQEINPEQLPVILMGDMNCEPDTDIFIPLKENGFSIANRDATKFDTKSTFNSFSTDAPPMIIDHIYYKKLKAVEFKTITASYGVPFVSDHYPVFTLFVY